MRTPYVISLLVLMGTAACNNAENKDAAGTYDNKLGTLSAKNDVSDNEAAIQRRSMLMDERTACILKADDEVWKTLSLTTDQIRWMQELRLRMRVPDKQRDAEAKDDHAVRTYTLSAGERRKLAEILTDEQLVQWMTMCNGDGEVVAAR